MATYKARVKGAKEIERMLKDLPRKVQNKSIKAALTPALEMVVKEAQARAPVGQTGRLRKRIRKRWGRGKKGLVVGKVGIFAKTAYYARFVDQGTKNQRAQQFMKRALNAQRRAAIRTISNELRVSIPREAKAAAR